MVSRHFGPVGFKAYERAVADHKTFNDAHKKSIDGDEGVMILD